MWSIIMNNPEALSVVDHRPLVLAGLAAVDYANLGPFLNTAVSGKGTPNSKIRKGIGNNNG
jgi:hypothetical protein